MKIKTIMKNLIFTLAFISLAFGTISCEDDDSAMPSDYTNLNVPGDRIDELLVGQWRQYTITRATYFNGQRSLQQQASFTGNFRFEAAPGVQSVMNVNDFPYNGVFAVTRYGERLAFYQRSTNQHMNLMIDEVTPTKLVLKQSELLGKDYFAVTLYTLTK